MLQPCNFNLWKQGLRSRLPSKTWKSSRETKLSRKTSLKHWNLKMWKHSRPWSEHSQDRFETVARQTFLIHLPRHVLCCKTHYFAHPLSLKHAFRARRPSKNDSGSSEKRSFRARLPSNTETWRCENIADHDPSIAKTVLKLSRGRPSSSIFRGTFCAAKHIISRIHYLSNTHFVRDVPQKMTAEAVKNEAFAQDFPQTLKLEDVKT